MILEAAQTRTSALHAGGWWTASYLQNHLWNDRLATATMALAVMDEWPDCKNWIDRAVSDYNLVSYYLGVDGGTHEGMLYWKYGMESYCQFKYLAKNVLQIDYTDDPYDKNAYLAPLYCYFNPQDWSKSANCLNYADSTVTGGGYAIMSIGLDYLAQTYNDGKAKWLANRMYDYVVETDSAYTSWFGFLYRDEVEEVDPTEELATGHLFEDLGIIQSRSQWGDNASYVHWRCGQNLGTEAMAYTGSGNLGSGHCHNDINAPLIYGYGEYILRDDGYTKGNRMNHSTLYINGSGQPRNTSVEYLRSTKPVVLKYIDTEDYTYAACDGTDAYTSIAAYKEEFQLDRWVRHFLYLKSKDCLLVIDEVNCAVEQDLQLQWITGVTALSNQGSNAIIGKGTTSQFKIASFDNMGTGKNDTVMEPREVDYMSASRNVATINKRAKDWTTATAITWSSAERSPRTVKLNQYKDTYTFDLDTAVVSLNIKNYNIHFEDYGNDLRVKLDQKFLKTDQDIIINETGQYMPFRDLFEGLGYKVNYLAENNTVEIISGDQRQVFALSDTPEEGKLWMKDGYTRITPDQMMEMVGIVSYYDDANNILKVKTYNFDNDTSLANVLVSGGTVLSTSHSGNTIEVRAVVDSELSLTPVAVSLSAKTRMEKLSDIEYKVTVTAEDRTTSTDYDVKVVYPQGLGDVPVKKITNIGDDGNIGPNSVDGNLGSYWAYNSREAWIVFEFDKEYTIDKIQTAWNAYAKRDAYYELYVSRDGENWDMLGDYTGLTGVPINDVNIDPVTCKYVKVFGKGNSIHAWTSLADIGFFRTK